LFQIANSFLPLCGIWNFLNENKVITGTADARRVEAVGTKIKLAAEKYLKFFRSKGYLNGYQWEYKLIDDKQINAWCMPGGKLLFTLVFYL
jgi:hypothetical protein